MRSARGAAVLAVSIAGAGCRTFPTCPSGVLPIDGATGVPLDAVVEFRGGPMPDDVPSLDDGVILQTDDGEEVPIEVVLDGDVVRGIPVEPLRPDTTYIARGVVPFEVSRGHWWGELPNTWNEVWFSTGGEPRILAATRPTEPGDVAVIAFTEPVDLDSVAAALRFDAGVRATVLGTDDRAENLVVVHLDPMPSTLRIRLVQGAVTARGAPIPPSGGFLRNHTVPEEFLALHRGEAEVCP